MQRMQPNNFLHVCVRALCTQPCVTFSVLGSLKSVQIGSEHTVKWIKDWTR